MPAWIQVFFVAMALQAPSAEDLLHVFPTFPEFTCEDGMSFCNRAHEAGLDTVLRYGRGAAWVDIDGDGWDDLFLVDADNRWDPDGYGVSMFFLNRRDGTFDPVPATELGIRDSDLASNWSASFADYDNDGDADLLLASGGYNGRAGLSLYENRIPDGKGLVSVTDSSGVDAANDEPWNWWGSSWADYDRDGWLDFVVTRTGGAALLFHNDADGTFTEVASSLGVGIPMQDGKNPLWIDYDDDGDPDLYLAGMNEHGFYRNDEGHFTDVTAEIFVGFWTGEPLPFVFSAAAEDFNQDGYEDLYLGRYEMQDAVMLNRGDGSFDVHTTDWGLVTTTRGGWASNPDPNVPLENTMGLGVGDLSGDGYPDVFVGTGHPLETASDIVFCNTVDDSFYRCTGDIIAGHDREWRTRAHGTVFSDYDHDGDMDVALNLGGFAGFDATAKLRISPEHPALFVNEAGATGNTATLTLVGTRSNRDAIGARLRVTGEREHYYTVHSMQGFQSQNSLSQVLSLGSAEEAEVEIRWPSGTSQTVHVKAGDRVEVIEATEEPAH